MKINLDAVYGAPSMVFTESTSMEDVKPPEPPPAEQESSKPPGDYKSDVQWVFDNFTRMVKIEPRKDPVILYDKLKAEAPSAGAEGLMIWAAHHQGNFYQQVCPRVLTKVEQAEAAGHKWNRDSEEDLEKLRQSVKQATGV